MSKRFEELDWTPTPMGDLMLRRRFDPVAEVDVFEVKLGEDFLMSSLFTVAEIALTRMALELLPDEPLDVVVGGLGLGYTAATALDDARVRSMLVIERLTPVISWHERSLIPAAVPSSQRTRLINDDFFALAAGASFDPEAPDRKFHAVILDVDHSPRHLLSPTHAGFYTADGTAHLASHLLPEGVFALWSNDPPDEDYLTTLRSVFPDARAEVVEFDNPLQARTSTNTIYVGRRTVLAPHSR
jgi:spermidine synthase